MKLQVSNDPFCFFAGFIGILCGVLLWGAHLSAEFVLRQTVDTLVLLSFLFSLGGVLLCVTLLHNKQREFVAATAACNQQKNTQESNKDAIFSVTKHTKQHDNTNRKWKASLQPLCETTSSFFREQRYHAPQYLVRKEDFIERAHLFHTKYKAEPFSSAINAAWKVFPVDMKYQGGETKARLDKKRMHRRE